MSFAKFLHQPRRGSDVVLRQPPIVFPAATASPPLLGSAAVEAPAAPLAAEAGFVPPVPLAVPVAVSLPPGAVPMVVASVVESVEPAPAAGPVTPVAGLMMFVVAPLVWPWPLESLEMPQSRPWIGGPAEMRQLSLSLLLAPTLPARQTCKLQRKLPKIYNVGMAIKNHPCLIVYTSHLW